MASAELRDTRRRIKSVEATAKITRAMELIAASRIPRAQARVKASKPYTAKLIEVIRNVGAASGGASHMLLEGRDVKTVGVLVISADRGLAGAYASSIIRMAEAAMIAHRRAGREVRLFAVGKKANAYFDYRGYAIERSFIGVTDTPGYGDARAVAATVMDAYAAGRVDAVEAFSTRLDSLLTQTPITFDLLPVQPPTGDEGGPAVSY
ncbi:MAG: F0F1 ATP synthase subunit gamma, partial [Actinomycetota bacterium]|nr:F0F1 ATP synthase subunit gamma [Actinomycetota bacterium]